MSYIPLNTDANNNVMTRISQHDIFDQVLTASRSNQVTSSFFLPGSVTDIVNISTTGSGAAISGNGKATFVSGTDTTSSVTATTPLTITYSPGFEIFSIFTSTWTTPTSANSTQFIGLWDTVAEGFYMGYNGTTFGVAVMTGSVQTFIPRSSWNQDLLDGSPTSKFTRSGVPEAINLTYLNLFRIRFGWLGAAPVLFEVASPDGNWVLFHVIQQPNTSASPHIQNPNLPLALKITKSAADSTNLTMTCACWAAGTAAPAEVGEIDFVETSWTSGTPLNSTLLTDTAHAGVASLTVINTGTITGGEITVEVSPDARNWFPVVMLSDPSSPKTSTYSLASGDDTFVAQVSGYVQIRIRLSSVIIGSGSVKVEIRPSATSVPQVVQAFSPTGTNFHVVVDSGNITTSLATSTVGNAPIAASVGVSSVTVLAANSLRKGAIFTNTSTNTISIGLSGNNAVLNSGITLVPYGTWIMDQYTFTTGAITAIASGAGSNLAIQEMQ